MCGPTSAQSNALASDTALGQELNNSYSADFSESQGLFNELNDNLASIVSAGPGQQGYSPEELAAMNSQAINSAAASNKDIQASVGEKAAAQDTANPGVESGVEEAVQAGAASKIANNLSNQEATITQENYAQGNKNVESAVAEESGLPAATIDPVTGTAKAAIGAEEETGEQANTNAQASSSWMGLLGGLTSGLAKGLGSSIGSGGGSTPLDPNADPNGAGLFGAQLRRTR